MDQIVNKERCTGCKMCADACPKGAIGYQADGEGFWYPVINKSECIDCGVCKKVCPQNKNYISDQWYPKVYSAYSRDDEIRLKSTSGGMFYILAKQIIMRGGYVVGCRYAKDYKSARHMIAHEPGGLDMLIGSKYFQSDTLHIYTKIKKLLDQQKEVLFCGTPCQTAALYQFLGREYPKLVTFDFICLGINSPKAFKAFVLEQEKKQKAKVRLVQLKNKKQGWHSLASYMEFENGNTFLKNKDEDWWIKGFIKENLYMRPSCYQCQYRKLPRVSDISVGDFWGIRNVSKSNLFKGVSAVMINSEKGERLFDSVKPDLIYKEKSMEELRQGNPALENDPVMSEYREKFFELLNSIPFSRAVKRCSPAGAKYVIKSCFPVQGIMRIYKERPFEYLQKRELLNKIDIKKFLYYNYCLPNIERERGCYLLIYKNSVIDLDETSKIYIYNRDIEVGKHKLKSSRAETYLKMEKNAQWISRRGGELAYNATLNICENAKFESGYFTVNSGSAIICARHIVFGNDVMVGRNVIILDSDHHQILDENNRVVNTARDTVIEDHVWLASNTIVLKGVHIEKGSIVGAGTVVTKDIGHNSMTVGNCSQRILKQSVKWNRKNVK